MAFPVDWICKIVVGLNGAVEDGMRLCVVEAMEEAYDGGRVDVVEKMDGV